LARTSASTLRRRFMPAQGNVVKFNRPWIATVLTARVAAGAALGVAAQVFQIWVIIGHLMPFFGLELLGLRTGLFVIAVG
jgi:hypothetical protein